MAFWLAARALGALSAGYVHPDEVFQSVEVVAAGFFGYDATIPWEYANCNQPARSIVPPMLSVGIPYAVVHSVSWLLDVQPSAVVLLVSVRLWLLGLSIGIEHIFSRVCTAHDVPWPPVAWLLRVSWVAWALLPRPFSNSLEALCLPLGMYTYTRMRQALVMQSKREVVVWCGLLGCVVAVGSFVRFTFPLFVLPLAAAAGTQLLLLPLYDMMQPRAKRAALARRLALGLGGAVAGVCALMATCVCIVAADTRFFAGAWPTLQCSNHSHSQQMGEGDAAVAEAEWFSVHADGDGARVCAFSSCWQCSWSPSPLPLVAPVTNARYNLDPANLALHGTHPRWNHALLNMSIMYGPAWWLLVAGAAVQVQRTCRRRSNSSSSSGSSNSGSSSDAALSIPAQLWQLLCGRSSPASHLYFLCASCVVSSLAGLSSAPHQEARFLLPLLWPLAPLLAALLAAVRWEVLHGHPKSKSVSQLVLRYYQPVFVVFNLVLFVIYGLLHQAGVYPALALLSSRATLPTSTAAVVAGSISPWQLAPLLSHATVLDAGALSSATAVVFIGTYMPPTSLLLQPCNSMRSNDKGSGSGSAAPWCDAPSGEPWCVHTDGGSSDGGGGWLQVVDETRTDADALTHRLQQQCRGHASGSLLVVAPASLEGLVLQAVQAAAGSTADEGSGAAADTAAEAVALHAAARLWPHLSTEAWPSSLDQLSVVAWSVPCSIVR